MECSCNIDIYDGDFDPITRHSTKPQKARKPHKCSECAQPISKGEQYRLDKYKCNGRFWTHKTCSDCLSLMDQFFQGGHIFSAVREYVAEHIRELDGEIPESCISALTPGARAFVCEEVEWAWERLEESVY